MQLLKGSKPVRLALGILVCAAAAAVAAYVTSAGKYAWAVSWRVLVLFALLGVFIGSITMLDERSPDAIGNYPIARALLCAVSLGAAVALVPMLSGAAYHPSWSVTAAVVGALLGWFGWRWARHVDF